MKNFKQLLLILILANLIASQDDDEDLKPGLGHLQGTHLMQTFESYKEKANSTMFVFYYNPNSMQSIGLSAILPQVRNKVKHYVEFVYVDCSLPVHKNTKGCEEGIIPDFELDADDDKPKKRNKLEQNFNKLELYTPVDGPTVADPREKTVYRKNNYQIHGSIAEAPITAFITKAIVSRSNKLDFHNFNEFLEDNTKVNKIILITKKRKTPLIFKGLSCFYFGKIAFGEIHESETQLIEKLGAKDYKIPCLLMYQTLDENGKKLENEKITLYEGEQNPEEISKFLDKYALYVSYEGEKQRIENFDDL